MFKENRLLCHNDPNFINWPDLISLEPTDFVKTVWHQESLNFQEKKKGEHKSQDEFNPNTQATFSL
jgi:hypothetical protein